MHLELFSNHLKDRKIHWTVRPPNHKICSFFCWWEPIPSMWFKKSKSIKYLSKKKNLTFSWEKLKGCVWRKYSVLNNNSNVIWESRVLASDQCILEIPSEAPELRTVLLCLVAWCCCMNVFSSATVAQGHSGWAPSAQLCSLLARAALPGIGSIPGRCQTRAGTHCTRECLDDQHFRFVRKDVLVYQTVSGMQIN